MQQRFVPVRVREGYSVVIGSGLLAKSGQLLRVLSTDGGALRDFQAFARQTGNELVEQTTEGEVTAHVLRRR